MLGGRQCVSRGQVEGSGGCSGAQWLPGDECALGQLLSEVALAVEFKEEVSWQKEKIEGVVQFPSINNPDVHVTSQSECLQPQQISELLSMELS